VASGIGSLGTGIAFEFGGIILVCAIGLALTLIFMALAVWSNQRVPAVQVSGD
jgi:ABC-type nickel/cobalt efflux system permease component RcnA